MEPDRPDFRHGLPMRLFGWVQVRTRGRLLKKRESRFVKLNGEVMSLHESEHALPVDEFDIFGALVDYTHNPARKDFRLTVGKRSYTFIFNSFDEMLTWAQSIDLAAERDFSEYYSLGKRIGTGTYSNVYLAEDRLVPGALFAVKQIQKKHRRSDLELKKWIERERHVNTVLAHRCVVAAVDMFCTLDYVHIVFEFMPGGTVRDLLSKYGALGESYARTIMRELLTALQYIHAKNIVHRDIRPDNIFCSATRFPMVIALGDFGFSTFISDKIVNCDVLTTPMGVLPYTATEICKKQKYGPSVDLWSAGVVMYELLCGSPPFVGRNNRDTSTNIVRGAVSFRGKAWANVSSQAIGLVQQLLQIDPHKRISALAALQHSWFNNTGSNLAGSKPSTPLITPSESARALFDQRPHIAPSGASNRELGRRDSRTQLKDRVAEISQLDDVDVSDATAVHEQVSPAVSRSGSDPSSSAGSGDGAGLLAPVHRAMSARVAADRDLPTSSTVSNGGYRASAPAGGMQRCASERAPDSGSASLQYTASLSSLSSGAGGGPSRMAMTPSIQRIASMGLQGATRDNPERMKAFLKSPVVKSQLSSMFPMRRKLILWCRVFIAVFRIRALAKGESMTRQLTKAGSAHDVDLAIAERRKEQAEQQVSEAKKRASARPEKTERKEGGRGRGRHIRTRSREATSALFQKLSPSGGAPVAAEEEGTGRLPPKLPGGAPGGRSIGETMWGKPR